MFDYLAISLSRKRRAGDVPAKTNLDDVIADNIQATQDLAETITRYNQSVARLGSKSERARIYASQSFDASASMGGVVNVAGSPPHSDVSTSMGGEVRSH